MESPDDLKKKARAKIWLRLGVVLAFIFALTWSLQAGLNWILFASAACCFFLAWYYQPRNVNPDDYRQGPDPGTMGRRFALIAVAIVFGSFILLVVIGINATDDSSETDSGTETVSSTEEAESTEPDLLNTLTDRANEFYNINQYDSANALYDKVLQLDPNNTAALYNKGLICYNQQKYSEAFPYFSRAYDGGMRDAFLSHILAFLYDNQGNASKAVEFYKDALLQDSSRSEIYPRLAELDPSNSARYRALELRWKK